MLYLSIIYLLVIDPKLNSESHHLRERGILTQLRQL